MQTNEFAGSLFRSTAQMLTAIAHEYWTAGGNNTPEMIDAMLPVTAESAARECIEGWGLDQAQDDSPEDEPQSHMDLNGYTDADLAEAMQNFMNDRPDRRKDD